MVGMWPPPKLDGASGVTPQQPSRVCPKPSSKVMTMATFSGERQAGVAWIFFTRSPAYCVAAADQRGLFERLAVGGTLGAVQPVHLVALVGHDQGEGGQMAGGQVGVELLEVDEVLGAVRVVLDRGEVDEAGVLGGVEGRSCRSVDRCRVAGGDGERSGRGQVLVVALPASGRVLLELQRRGAARGSCGRRSRAPGRPGTVGRSNRPCSSRRRRRGCRRCRRPAGRRSWPRSDATSP